MSLLISDSLVLWQDIVKHAEDRCSVNLTQELETYLVSLLMRYVDKPEVAQQVFATAFIEALNKQQTMRQQSLQNIGDQCLLFAGLFPRVTERKRVKLSYFVDLGKSAYSMIAKSAVDLNALYASLATQFVVLMDVLQSLREYSSLTPIEAYEQWHELGSQRAYLILQSYRRCNRHQ